MSAGAAQTLQIGGHAFTLRDLTPGDSAQLQALHRLVFGPEADSAWADWKYGQGTGQGHGLGCGVWQSGELIAHCGGLPRTLWHGGQAVQGIQIGDVMVAPQWRGILTRRGPFFHASQAFYQRQVGAQQAHQIAFGFPSERHLRLAVTLKLLWDGGPIHALTWDTQAPAAPARPAAWPWHWHELQASDPAFDATVNRAWSAMQAASCALTLGQRDVDYLRWRYVARPPAHPAPASPAPPAPSSAPAMPPVPPAPRYRFFTLQAPWPLSSGSGVAVLSLQGAQAQWLDWIGPPAQLARVAQACRWQAGQAGAASLHLWASPHVAQALQGSGVAHSSVTAWLGIPQASVITPPDFPAMHWWLMGGDTDFL